ncbi:pseudouridylate synthase [Fibrella sp. HMF5335]|uniref:Pseudouridylate synthase n=1 Tax=Fibrella rubiginis TaxID=2817060 RepID=A0A939K2M5_9BACT|nr:pseudouridine synthase [Fibrella rubiginis]MBO0938362.1 pseudouridylate synthase [Fibrella rubiginis]
MTDVVLPSEPLPILYQSADMVAINKPHGLLVHRSPIAADAHEFAVQLLRDQLGQRVFPAHRLDRKTGGVLLFALNETMNAALQQQFADGQMHKTYWAIVRGYTPDFLDIDYPLRRDEDNVLQDAFTSLTTLRRAEIPLPFGKHTTSRYSLVELTPTTGRMHQLRKHMAHVFHPIIGDRPHGCNKQNRLFLSQFGMNTMLLHARQLAFRHPVSGETLSIEAPLQSEFTRMMAMLFSE